MKKKNITTILVLAVILAVLGSAYYGMQILPTEVFADNFETGDLSKWDSMRGSPSVQTSLVHGGSYAMKCEVATGTTGTDVVAVKTLATLYSTLYAEAYINLNASGPNYIRGFIALRDGGSVLKTSIGIDANRYLQIYYLSGTGFLGKTSSSQLTLNVWYCLGVYVKIGGTDGEVKVYLNHNEVTDLTQTALNNTYYSDIKSVEAGLYLAWATSRVYLDDLSVSTDASPPPTLTVSVSPKSATILTGQSQTFTTSASGGTTPYTYSWTQNGTKIQGATSSNLTFTPSTSGTYNIAVKVDDSTSGTAHQTASDTAVLFVQTEQQQTTYTLVIQSSQGGTVTPSIGSHIYDSGTTVNLTATPNVGFNFSQWTVDTQNYTTPNITITMDTNHVAQANFINAETGETQPLQETEPENETITEPGTTTTSEEVAIALGVLVVIVVFWAMTKKKKAK